MLSAAGHAKPSCESSDPCSARGQSILLKMLCISRLHDRRGASPKPRAAYASTACRQSIARGEAGFLAVVRRNHRPGRSLDDRCHERRASLYFSQPSDRFVKHRAWHACWFDRTEVDKSKVSWFELCILGVGSANCLLHLCGCCTLSYYSRPAMLLVTPPPPLPLPPPPPPIISVRF